MGKRVFVTGASGFVGANLARRLLRDGHEVHLALRASHRPWRVHEIAGQAHCHAADVADGAGIARIVSEIRPEWVFHLAAYGAYSTQTGLDRMLATNVAGAAALIDACAAARVEAFVQAGSSSEYGYKDHPAAEDERLEPNSDYAVTKAAATHYCQLAARRTGLHAVTARLYSIYGPYEEPTRLVPTLVVRGIEGALPPLVSPATARDFVYIDDAVEAMLRIAQRSELPRGSVFNVCTGRQSTLASLVTLARTRLGIAAEPVWSSMPARSWDTDVWVGSPEALERAIGWRPEIDLAAGLDRTIEWFRSRPEWLEFYAAAARHPSQGSRAAP